MDGGVTLVDGCDGVVVGVGVGSGVVVVDGCDGVVVGVVVVVVGVGVGVGASVSLFGSVTTRLCVCVKRA